jgi:Mn2+/Fe2+ NRAMP family transporter
MKRFFASLVLLMIISTVMGDVHVRGYYREDGTYVRPHYRSDPDGDFSNNWSTYPNVNPYTGKVGTRIMPTNSYGGSYYYQDGSLGNDGVRAHSHSNGDGILSWSRLFLIIIVIALFSSAFIKKDEEQKSS